MAYQLQIVDQKNDINFNVKYENLDKDNRIETEKRAPNGDVVTEKIIYKGDIVEEYQKRYVDSNGNQYQRSEITHWYDGNEYPMLPMTTTFTIEEYQPVSYYTDNYIISAYYELQPSDNKKKKDFDRDISIKVNRSGMKKLKDYLIKTGQVARGEFIPGPGGKSIKASDGFIRAIQKSNDDKTVWTLEIGLFKDRKEFKHMQEDIQEEIKATSNVGVKKLKMV